MSSRGRIRGRTGTPKKEYHTKRLEMRFVEVDYVVQANSTNEAIILDARSLLKEKN